MENSTRAHSCNIICKLLEYRMNYMLVNCLFSFLETFYFYLFSFSFVRLLLLFYYCHHCVYVCECVVYWSEIHFTLFTFSSKCFPFSHVARIVVAGQFLLPREYRKWFTSLAYRSVFTMIAQYIRYVCVCVFVYFKSYNFCTFTWIAGFSWQI